MSRRCWLPLGLFASLVAVLCAGCVAPGPQPTGVTGVAFRVGGPCRYDVAVGIARILEVFPRAGAGANAVELELGLSLPAGFKPAAWWHDRTARVVVSGPPGPVGPTASPGLPDSRWLLANGLVAGASYPVEVSVIRSGTCTPLMLRFPGRPWIVE